nr:unnamed protein product [Callosobruchus analis]
MLMRRTYWLKMFAREPIFLMFVYLGKHWKKPSMFTTIR